MEDLVESFIQRAGFVKDKTYFKEMYLGDIHTVPVNIAGIPALSMPCGADENGLPVGLQLMGKTFSEPMLYRIGSALEEALGCTLKEATL